MVSSSLRFPPTDPTPIFEFFRGSYGTELLTAAVAHFDVFGTVARGPCTFHELREALGLAERPAVVLVTALRAMGLLRRNEAMKIVLTPLAEQHLAPDAEFNVRDYIGLAAGAPSVVEMVKRLRTNRPAGIDEGDEGVAYIYRQGVASAMEEEQLARHYTLALAGRAKNVAPVLAERVDTRDAKVLLDVAGGTGIYSIALLRKDPNLRAIVLDRPEVLRVTEEFAREYGVADRLDPLPGDMFADVLPAADVILLSNVLHDWDVPECRKLVSKCAQALSTGGRLWIHDVFLNDSLDGPLPVALYSAALFTLTEGRAYSRHEFRQWLRDAGLVPQPPVETLIHCAVLAGTKPE